MSELRYRRTVEIQIDGPADIVGSSQIGGSVCHAVESIVNSMSRAGLRTRVTFKMDVLGDDGAAVPAEELLAKFRGAR